MPECAICAAIAAEFTRLGVPEPERATYEYALGQDGGDVLTQLEACRDREQLDSLAERGVIAP